MKTSTLKVETTFKKIGSDQTVVGKPGDQVQYERSPVDMSIVIWLGKFSRRGAWYTKVEPTKIHEVIA